MPQLYTADITPKEAWEILNNNPAAELVDVRTEAERHYVGTPDLGPVKKELYAIEWRQLPHMEKNANFTKELQAVLPDKNKTLIFLCRTGGRSQEAAICAIQLGYAEAYNISYGFDGELNSKQQRGKINGWKADNLPWKQD
jgi:rhodanese-related sulfurtransferase